MSQDLRKKIISLHKKEFARAHADKDEDYWDSILWSDGTKINVFGTDGFKTVWRRKGEEYKEKCMVPTVKHGGGSVLMWGCMSAAGVGELHFIDGIMNSQMYCSILKEKVKIYGWPDGYIGRNSGIFFKLQYDGQTSFLPYVCPCVMLLYIICILIILHCPLSGPDSITFHF